MKMLRLLLLLLGSLLMAGEMDVVYRIPIKKTIDLGLPPFIRRAIAVAEAESARAIIFDIDTFGGRVDAATQIKDAILGATVPTVAFINRRAISAGSLIALSCETIYMTGGGTMGAATAVDLQGKKGSEKVISYMREEMAATAERHGRNVEIAKGMVDEELHFEYLIIDDDTVEVTDIEGRKEGKLITLTTELALKYKMADGKAENLERVLADLGLEGATVRTATINWSENFVRFLTHPIVASLLTTFGFLGILFELQSPGWGLPGTFGAVCLALSLGASYIAELATMTDLLIILVGVVLLMVEIFLIPGFGLAGLSGIGLLLWGLYELLLPDIPVGNEIQTMALTGLTIGILGGLVGLFLIFKLMTKTKFWKNLTAPGIESSKAGYSTSLGLEPFVGKVGIADTKLRPSGWIIVEAQRLFVVSEGTYVDKNELVKILSVEGNRIVVRKVNNQVKEN